MSTWINFEELRAKLKFESLLRYYQIEVLRKGEQHVGPCPLPCHRGDSAKPTFSANLERGIFQCFGCRAKGSALDFAILMENANPNEGRAVRRVALKLRRELLTATMPVESKRFSTKKPEAQPAVKEATVSVNAPLDFELKELEPHHLSLVETGLHGKTVAHFGLGYCSRGMFKDRIAFPLWDNAGRLIGYGGFGTGEQSPEYLFPVTREHKGVIYEFRKSLLLYNCHRIETSCASLIVVQSPASVWWLHQCGYSNVVALLGSECSREQVEQITALVRPAGRVWFMPDGGGKSESLAQSFVGRMSAHRFTRWVNLPADARPWDLTVEILESTFSS